ncbi:cytochrome c family protein [Sulfurovum sp. TSL1]|uniref:cytochrome c family protein n=1 Tax=Sulfurovum sp. TSL1 TaxID=2826994 RepID=UPI001CC384B7|nr:cytochrome c family protein [Sulfurovum sp. TSL1]GIT97873.1 hypothetical protein TSL1_06940 [Sulfurovum sp. TSL1]
MKLNVKSLTLLLSMGVILSLSGCGGGSDPATEITYTDYKGDTRTAALTPGDAEYHTGTGFDHTLLDSADKKCQHCHNELYDTWKGSMHGKSWADPIFQSKFQDFLRTHLAKIGSIGSGDTGIEYEQVEVGVGTKNMFSGAAQTCIKCHAPGAYYAGDVQVHVTEVQDATAINTTELDALKLAHEVNDPNGEIAVIAANSFQNKVYKATFQIGHEANREGINCAFCHSIETPRLMQSGDTYTLANTMRVGPHGSIKADIGDILTYSPDATDQDMNKFFRLWGPEKPKNYAALGSATDITNRAKDGRYSMARKDLNGTDGKVHYTGGPFYGPFGVTGITNENETDESNRSAYINPHFADAHLNPAFNGDGSEFNHFADHGKALCLSCHQRSAGAADPVTGDFMELCSTWNAVTTGDDNNMDDTMTSPKCQKCHMEKIEGTVLHQWARPDKLFTLADNPALTPHFDPADPENLGDESPVVGKWLNSHGFLGASKTGGDKVAAVAKIKSGFEGSVSTSIDGDILTVTTTLSNKTGHMFPGAHPMRRVLTRLIVTDGEGNKFTPTPTSSISTFTDATNTLATLTGKTLDDTQATTVTVMENGSKNLDFPGKVADLNGSAVLSQNFASAETGPVTISATDATVKNQTVTDGKTTGTIFNAAIVDASDTTNFTRIYGHETGKKYDLDNNESTPKVFVVRPGFDSNVVDKDTRLSPNETETYTFTYNISGKTGVSATYKVYYMQKGANGQFIVDPATGFLDQAASDAAKHLVTEVGSYTAPVN